LPTDSVLVSQSSPTVTNILSNLRTCEQNGPRGGKRHAILESGNVNPLPQTVQKGVEILRKGGVIAFPTDTVYGLGAYAFSLAAVERIYAIKNRPGHRQFPLLIADMGRLTELADPVPEIAWFLAKRFWPGGLTLVLTKRTSVAKFLTPGPTVAVRVPNHPVCLTLIDGLAGPLVGTSANISGESPALTAGEVQQRLGGKVDFIIDGGRCPGGKESTVVDVTGDRPVTLREGIIPSPEVDEVYREYLEAK
jgi:L-threonylcarbamoyladenylate synthase